VFDVTAGVEAESRPSDLDQMTWPVRLSSALSTPSSAS
jgi:hypothetical protein